MQELSNCTSLSNSVTDNIQDYSPISYDNNEQLRRIEEFGASEITQEQIERFPNPVHRLIRRKVFFAERGLDDYLSAVRSGRRNSIVTGIGPSGPMHIGHIIPLYFAKYMQVQTDTNVYIPISDDEKYLTRDMSMQTVQDYTRENLKDILAVGFEPSKTRIIIDTDDTDVIYPVSVKLSKHLTNSQVKSVYGESDNIGESFYPSVQTSHLLIPQLLYGEHPSMVLSAGDQDPHVRLARDVASLSEYEVSKPKSLFTRDLPSLKNPTRKMSSSSDEPIIRLSDEYKDIEDKIKKYAYSGGKQSKKEHREEGGNPRRDASYALLYFFFEQNDEVLKDVFNSYSRGDMLSGELKNKTVDSVSDFISEHQARKNALGSLQEEMDGYRLTKSERNSILTRVGYNARPTFE